MNPNFKQFFKESKQRVREIETQQIVTKKKQKESKKD